MTQLVPHDAKEALGVCIEIGRFMLSNGAETYRVEDTMYRIGSSFNLDNINVFVVPTAIIMTTRSIDGQDYTQLARVTERYTNLELVAELNQLSRDLTAHPASPNEVRAQLYLIQLHIQDFSPIVTFLLSAMSTSVFPVLFGGGIGDMLPAFFIGGIGQLLFDYVNRITNISFFAEMIASFSIGLMAVISFHYGIGDNMNAIIISSVMTMVPGIAITNGIRDLMAGHLLAGVSVLAKALLTAAAIGIGIAVVLTFV